jgi:hypothetical protein
MNGRTEISSPFQAKNKPDSSSLIGSRRESVTDNSALIAFSPAQSPMILEDKTLRLSPADGGN